MPEVELCLEVGDDVIRRLCFRALSRRGTQSLG